MSGFQLSRRKFLFTAGAVGISATSPLTVPFYNRRFGSPDFTHGVQSGDVDFRSGMVWTRVDRPSEILVEYSTSESFDTALRLPPLQALPGTDFAVKAALSDLMPDQEIFYRFTATDLYNSHLTSHPVTGRFRTAPLSHRPVRFVWSGDTAGQGWGIDEIGMKTYSTMALHEPDFFIHSGDTIYADGPIPDEITMRNGRIWKNKIVTDEKRNVARTLDEYRGQWKYNMLDDHVKAMNAVCPTFYQWDDHEVLNNWSASTDLRDDPRYPEKDVNVYVQRAKRAFEEMTPISYSPKDPGAIYRKIAYGPLLDVFFVDLRSYRGPNQAENANALFGQKQMDWLKRELVASKAVWKVMACDMPIGLKVWDDFADRKGSEAVSDGYDGVPDGRERDMATLLRYLKENGVQNMVWLTADVHYTAAHYYNPNIAKFQDFAPFWEFVSGPLHAGTYGAKELDKTFGPEVKFMKAAAGGIDQNLPPTDGLQFFGLVDINPRSSQMTVRLMDRDDQELWQVVLDPVLTS